MILLTLMPTPVGEIRTRIGRMRDALEQIQDRASLRTGRLAASTAIELKPTRGRPGFVHLHGHIWQAADQNIRPTSTEGIDAGISSWWQRSLGPAAGRAGCELARDPMASLAYTFKGSDLSLFLHNPARFQAVYEQAKGLRLHGVSGAFRRRMKPGGHHHDAGPDPHH